MDHLGLILIVSLISEAMRLAGFPGRRPIVPHNYLLPLYVHAQTVLNIFGDASDPYSLVKFEGEAQWELVIGKSMQTYGNTNNMSNTLWSLPKSTHIAIANSICKIVVSFLFRCHKNPAFCKGSPLFRRLSSFCKFALVSKSHLVEQNRKYLHPLFH